MPFRVRQGRAYGPGILDMKSGIVCALWAVRALQRLGIRPASPVRFFLNPDEETASVAFRKRLLAEARAARAVLVLEPAGPGGTLKIARKGVGKFRVTVHGRSAHAGVDPENGVNAISELVRQLLRIEKLAAPRRGLTLNVGVIQGGTRTNVIPETAWAVLDVRIPLLRDQSPIERKVHALKPFNPQARLEITGGINRPPMERKVAKALFRRARELGRELGMEPRRDLHGRRLRWEFHRRARYPDARWPRRRRQRRPRPPRAHHCHRTSPPRRPARGPDCQPVAHSLQVDRNI